MTLITTLQVAQKLNLSTASLHQLRRRDAGFPKPVKVGPKIFRWNEDELEEWINKKTEVTANGESRRVG